MQIPTQLVVNNVYVLATGLVLLTLAGLLIERIAAWLVAAFGSASIDTESPLLGAKERARCRRIAADVLVAVCVGIGVLLAAGIGYLTYTGFDLYSHLLAREQLDALWGVLGSVGRWALDVLLLVCAAAVLNAAGRIVCVRTSEALGKSDAVPLTPERLAHLTARGQAAVAAIIWLLAAGMLCHLLRIGDPIASLILLPFSIAAAFTVAVLLIEVSGTALDVLNLRTIGRWEATGSPWPKHREHLDAAFRRAQSVVATGIGVFAFVVGVAIPLLRAAAGSAAAPEEVLLPFGVLLGRIVLVWVIALPAIDVLRLAETEEHGQRYHWVRGGVWAVATLVTLQSFGVELSGLWILLAAALVALGLALRSRAEDIAAALLIRHAPRLAVGDMVRIGPHEGRVEEIGAWHTKLRDAAGAIHAIPNGDIRAIVHLAAAEPTGDLGATREVLDACADTEQAPSEAPERVE